MKTTGGAGGKSSEPASNRADTSRSRGDGIDFSASLGQSRQLEGDASGNLWQSILNDVAQRDDVKESHLLILGDKGSGKRSIVQAINKNYIRATNKFLDVDKMGSLYAGIDSAFLYVKDLSEKDALSSIVTSDENLPKLNVWMLQHADKVDLLPIVLRPESLERTCAVIVLDFDQPWEMMNALQRWMGALQDTIFQLMPKLPLQLQDKMRNKLTTYVKTYEDPDTSDTKLNGKFNNVESQFNNNDEPAQQQDADYGAEDIHDLKASLPLKEGVLKVNLGIPIIVVCSKVDLLIRGEKATYLESNLDFIQRHLRTYCLSYAASLMFVDTLQQTNLELLYRYILHRIYDSEFSLKPQIHEKESVFIPTGFDSQMLINELCKSAGDGEQFYEERIKKPQTQSIQVKPDIHCEEWQSLLSQIQNRRKGQGAAVQLAGLPVKKSEEEMIKRENVIGFYQGLMKQSKNRKDKVGSEVKKPAIATAQPGDVPSRNDNSVLQALTDKHSKNSVGGGTTEGGDGATNGTQEHSDDVY